MRSALWFSSTILAAAVLGQAQVPEGAEYFEKEVRPVLATYCVSCHSEKTKTAGLDLSTTKGIAAGGESGSLFNKGEASASRLLHVTSYDEKLKMPPGKKLPETALKALAAWVAMGAPLPAYKLAEKTGPSLDPSAKADRRKHWSFQPVKHYPPPVVKNESWIRSPIDRFVLAALEAKGLNGPRDTDKLALLRRATFDLHGLPPTEEAMKEFLSDASPDAFAKVVDKLLASPRYGEQWGRHWLDVARYAETGGVDENTPYTEAWRYREYVIDAFNRDVPYNVFVSEQIAGDLLPDPANEVNARGIVATGFLGLGPKAIVEIDKTKTFYDVVDEQIDTASKAFLGLTISCARCHDHKFDPISTKDYYSLAAIFANTRSFENNVDRGSSVYLAPLVPKETYEIYKAHQEKIARRNMQAAALLETEVWKYLSASLFPRMPAYMIAARRVQEGRITREEAAKADNLDPKILVAWLKYLDPKGGFRPHLKEWQGASETNLLSTANMYAERFQNAARRWQVVLEKWKEDTEAAVQSRRKLPKTPNVEFNDGKAAFSEPSDRLFVEVAIRAKTLNDRTSVDGPFVVPEAEQESYLPPAVRDHLAVLRKESEELAKSSPPKPPMANAVAEGPAVQQKVFVRGSHFNPGETVPKAVPEVARLDHEQFPREGSGRKELAGWITDPRNPLTARVIVNRVWLWHFGHGLVRTPNNFGVMGEAPTHPELLDHLASRFIEEGWSIKKLHRMIMLSSAYQSSSEVSDEAWTKDPANRLLSRFPRRRIRVEEMRDAWLQFGGTLDLKTGGIFDPVDPVSAERGRRIAGPSPRSFEVSKRRSIYLAINRNVVPTPMVLNDFVDSTASAGERPETITAPQALYLMNNPFFLERAKAFASKLLAGPEATDEERIRRGFRIAWNREPLRNDVDQVLRHLQRYPAQDQEKAAGWQSFCRFLLSSNQFHYID